MLRLFLLSLLLTQGSCLITPVGDCPPNLRPTMVRLTGAIASKPQFVAKIDLATCSLHCRRNTHPLTDAPFACRGFNFLTGRNPTCEFFTLDQLISSEDVEIKEGSYFFEKACLRIPPRCEGSAFALDGRRGVRLKTNRETRLAYSEEECIYACFFEDCKAFEWNNLRRTCAVYHETRRDVDVERVQAVTYYENNCIDPSSRCPLGRVEFLLVRRSDVQSFGVSIGIRSIRNCMRECVETTLFHCRSFQFSPSSSECFVSDESSEVAVPSANLDLYEPFCVPHDIDSNSCNRPYSFEKLITSKMTQATEVERFHKLGIEQCLNKCLSIKRCRSVNYDVTTRTCILLDKTRSEASVAPDENFDFYELACEPVSLTVSPLNDDKFQIFVVGRSFKSESNNEPHLNVKSAEHCWQLCRQSSTACNFFAFSSTLYECQLTSIDITVGDEDAFTIPQSEFSIYIVSSVSTVSSPGEELIPMVSSTTIPPSFYPTLVPEISTTSSPLVISKHDNSVEDPIFLFASSEFTAPTEDFPFGTSALNLAHTTSVPVIHETTVISTTTTSTSTSTSPVSTQGPSKLEFLHPVQSLAASFGKRRDSKQEVLHEPIVTVSSSFEEEDVGKEPVLLPESRGIGYARPDSIKVHASCYSHGMNVTFRVNDTKKYTGAVYAVERFEQCRVIIKEKTEFALFIPRPKHNTCCNAIESNGSMSVMIVMSNDRVIPYDVTTVNDLFYHASCSFDSSSPTILQQGLVVGGPSPVALPQNTSGRKISLKITKKGKPVDSVFIGETLVAHVESDFPAQDLRIVDCSANRVGGTGTPSSIHLIADGCALLPSLMSAMFLGPHGWQATLSAFRIDGSEHIDIVCMVAICEENSKCSSEKASCPPPPDRIVRSLDDSGEIRVDSRLRVRGDNNTGPRLPQVCLQPALYISILILLTISMLAMCISIGSGFLRHRRRVAGRSILQHTLADDSRYIKTMAL
ncbi:unnamed protein product [Auanema sp. JU1783]|nr:unnamed protein product [Auanema sp. JU1783]